MPTVPLTHAKTHLTRLLSEVEQLGEKIVITRSGRPAGVLLSVDEYEGLLETLEILADDELARAVREGVREAEEGSTVSDEEAWDGLDSPVRG